MAMQVGENVPTANICAYMLNIANMRQYASLLRQFPNQNHLRGCIILTGIVIVFSSCRWNWRMLWPSLTSPASMCDNLKIQMCDLKISISEMNIQLGVIGPWLCVPILSAKTSIWSQRDRNMFVLLLGADFALLYHNCGCGVSSSIHHHFQIICLLKVKNILSWYIHHVQLLYLALAVIYRYCECSLLKVFTLTNYWQNTVSSEYYLFCCLNL